jgi:DNA-directed RNA polymerase specialized sigma24 family protein
MEHSNQLSLPASVPRVACDFDALFTAYYRRLTRLLYRATGDTTRAEGFAAEAFWRLYDKPPKDVANIEAWLYRTGLRLALDHLKKERRRARYEALALLFGVAPNLHQAVELQEKQARVRTDRLVDNSGPSVSRFDALQDAKPAHRRFTILSSFIREARPFSI